MKYYKKNLIKYNTLYENIIYIVFNLRKFYKSIKNLPVVFLTSSFVL